MFSVAQLRNPYEENIIYYVLFLGPDDDINFLKDSPRPNTDIKILALWSLVQVYL